jgi:hypothetical protein
MSLYAFILPLATARGKIFGIKCQLVVKTITIIFRFVPKIFEMTTEKVFHADDKYVLRLLNVIIHEHQFKRKGKYYKFHFQGI